MEGRSCGQGTGMARKMPRQMLQAGGYQRYRDTVGRRMLWIWGHCGQVILWGSGCCGQGMPLQGTMPWWGLPIAGTSGFPPASDLTDGARRYNVALRWQADQGHAFVQSCRPVARRVAGCGASPAHSWTRQGPEYGRSPRQLQHYQMGLGGATDNPCDGDGLLVRVPRARVLEECPQLHLIARQVGVTAGWGREGTGLVPAPHSPALALPRGEALARADHPLLLHQRPPTEVRTGPAGWRGELPGQGDTCWPCSSATRVPTHRLRMLMVQGELPGWPPTMRPFCCSLSSRWPH